MISQLSVQRPFEHRLGHLVQQFLRAQRPTIRIRVFHQRIKRFRRQHASERFAGRRTRDGHTICSRSQREPFWVVFGDPILVHPRLTRLS